VQRRIPYTLLALAALVLALAACGSDEDADDDGGAVASIAEEPTDSDTAASGEPAADTASDDEDRQAALLKYTSCMRDNGVDMEDPVPGEPFRLEVRRSKDGNSTFEKAQKACQKLLKGAVGEPSAEDRERMREAGLKFAKCMRAEGIDMPDPEADGGMLFKAGEGGIDPEDPTFQKAQKKCQPLLRVMREEPDAQEDS
jgi:hypothetical protein